MSIFHKVLLFLPVWVLAYRLLWLTLVTIATGMCLMNGYEIVKVRSIPTKKKQMSWDKFPFSSVSSLISLFSTTYFKNFFILFSAAEIDFATA